MAGGGHAWQGVWGVAGGMHGRGVHGRGACVAGGGAGSLHGGGMHGQGACVAGGVAGVCMAEGCTWQGGVCGRGGAWQGGAWQEECAWQERRPLQLAVRILLECILVDNDLYLLEFLPEKQLPFDRCP